MVVASAAPTHGRVRHRDDTEHDAQCGDPDRGASDPVSNLVPPRSLIPDAARCACYRPLPIATASVTPVVIGA